MKPTIALTTLLLLAGCTELPERSHPLDPNGPYAGQLDPDVSVSYDKGALLVSWTKLEVPGIAAYRLYRTIGSGAATLVYETWSGGAMTYRDMVPFPAGTSMTYAVSVVLDSGSAESVGDGSWSTGDDLDGDGSNTDDCAANIGSIYPGAPEVCNLVDDDCDGIVDNFEAACDPGPDAGTTCGVRACAHGAWGACQARPVEECETVVTPPVDVCATTADCVAGTICLTAVGVCATPCTNPDMCADGESCVAGGCLQACPHSNACEAGETCIFGTQEPAQLGGCAPAPASCGTCADGRCLVADNGDVQCCQDADSDGHYSLACSWGSDCDDSVAGVQTGCDTCTGSAQCPGGAQCVLVGNGVGVCGGPAGCHCPSGSLCDTSVSPAECTGASCVGQLDCEVSQGPGFSCLARGQDSLCVCTDPKVCPQCVIDEECPQDHTCNLGTCEPT